MDSNNGKSKLAEVEASLDDFSLQMKEISVDNARLLKEFNIKMQELRDSQAETDRQIKQIKDSQAETARQIKESQAETARQIKEVSRQLGGMGNTQGTATTELFYNSLKYGQKKMFGEEFDDVFKEEARKTKKGFEDEYDILMFNGQAVCIVEVKYKADTNDVKQLLRKESTFRENFPEHNNKKLYLAMASRSFHHLTEKACKDNGIAIMKQVGGTVVISDENLKVF